MGIWIVVVIVIVIWLSANSRRKQQEAERARIDHLIDLQNYLTGIKSHSLNMSEKELLRALKQYVHRRAQIMQDCQEILNKTKSPKTFFSRLDLLFETKKDLDGLEEVHPGSIRINFVSDAQFSILKNEMIDRFWMDCVEKSINASTLKTKNAKIHAFFETLALYEDQLDNSNRQHIDSYKEKAMELYIKHSR